MSNFVFVVWDTEKSLGEWKRAYLLVVYTARMNKKYILPLVLVVFIASGIFYRQLFKPNSTTTKNLTLKNTGEQTTANTAKKNVLDLSNQGLDKLPSYVTNLSNLEELNISNNNITGALPSQMQNLRKLRVLNASNNLMTGVPAEIGQLQNLEVLDLSNNQLTGLPNELANLKNLKTLNLSGNNYSTMDLEVIKKGLSSGVNIIL